MSEEKEMRQSIAKGEWKTVRNVKKEIGRFKRYAAETLKKDKRVNIRLSSQDLYGIQQKAIDEGIPYQTLLASVIHKYVTGSLVDRRSVTNQGN